LEGSQSRYLRSTSATAIATTLGDGEEAIPFGLRTQACQLDEDTVSALSDTDNNNPRGRELSMASNADVDRGPSMVSVLGMMSKMLQLSRNEMKMEV